MANEQGGRLLWRPGADGGQRSIAPGRGVVRGEASLGL